MLQRIYKVKRQPIKCGEIYKKSAPSQVQVSLTYMIEQGQLWCIPGRLVSQWLVPSRDRLIGLLSWEEAFKQRL